MKRHYFKSLLFILFMGDIMAHKHMNLKSTKKKKKFVKIKLFCLLIIIYGSFSYSFYIHLKHRKKISNEEFINLIVKSGNANILSKYELPNLVNSTVKMLLRIDFTNPISIFRDNILQFGENVKDNHKTISLEYNDDYSDMEDIKTISEHIDDPNPHDVNNPILYLYNSHQLENYSNDKLDVYGITPNVMMASYVLREKLGELGIVSIVEEANMSDILNKNGWNYSYSYHVSRSLMEAKKKEYPSLKYFIDIHRDSVGRNSTLISINNTNYAKVLFVIGLDYSGWEANYQFANVIHEAIQKKYPGLSRGIMKKSGINVNGVYNQDFNPNCILIEVGGVENNIDEVYQTMGVLADVISKYIKGDLS